MVREHRDGAALFSLLDRRAASLPVTSIEEGACVARHTAVLTAVRRQLADSVSGYFAIDPFHPRQDDARRTFEHVLGQFGKLCLRAVRERRDRVHDVLEGVIDVGSICYAARRHRSIPT